MYPEDEMKFTTANNHPSSYIDDDKDFEYLDDDYDDDNIPEEDLPQDKQKPSDI